MDEGKVMKEVYFYTKGSCFICLNPMRPKQEGTYSLGALCAFLNMDKELLRVLAKDYEIDVDLLVTLCIKCGRAVRRLTELLQRQEVNPKVLVNSLEVFGRLVVRANKNARLVMQFQELMTTGEHARSGFRMDAVEAVRTIMADDCLKLAEEKKNPPRMETETQSNNMLGQSCEGLGVEQSDNPTQLHSGGMSALQVDLETAHTMLMLHESEPQPPVVPSKPKKSTEMLYAHVSSGIEALLYAASSSTPPPTFVPSIPKPCLRCKSCGKDFESVEMLYGHARQSHSAIEALLCAASTSEAHHSLHPQPTQLQQVSTSLNKAEANFHGVKGNQTCTAQVALATPVHVSNQPFKLPLPPPSVFAPTSSSGSEVMKSKRMPNPRKVRNECHLCSKDIMGRKAFHDHLTTVHGQMIRVTCPLCDKDYADIASWKRHHQSKHEGIKFECGSCHKLFSYSDSLLSHLYAVHYRREYECRHCSKIFSNRSTMYRHMKKVCPNRISQPAVNNIDE